MALYDRIPAYDPRIPAAPQSSYSTIERDKKLARAQAAVMDVGTPAVAAAKQTIDPNQTTLLPGSTRPGQQAAPAPAPAPDLTRRTYGDPAWRAAHKQAEDKLEADNKAQAQRRAAAPQAAPAQYAAGGVISGDTIGAEKERKQRMSELDSAMFQLGSLNMRSKRDMYMGMLKGKQELSSMNYDTQNKRDMQRAQMDQETSLANARLGEEAAGRRDKMGQFNEQLGWDKDKFGQQLGWDKDKFGQQLAHDNKWKGVDSKWRFADFKDRQADRLQRRADGVASAAAERQAKESEAAFEERKYLNERADKYFADFMKQNPGSNRAQAMASWQAEMALGGIDTSNSDAGVVAKRAQDLAAKGNASEGTGFVQRFVRGRSGKPYDEYVMSEHGVPDVTQWGTRDTGGVVGLGAKLNDLFGVGDNDVTEEAYYVDSQGREVVQDITKAERKTMERDQASRLRAQGYTDAEVTEYMKKRDAGYAAARRGG